jgi:hypothetical protein
MVILDYYWNYLIRSNNINNGYSERNYWMEYFVKKYGKEVKEMDSWNCN